MYDSVLIYSRHHAPQQTASLFFCCKVGKVRKGVRAFRKHFWNAPMESHVASQPSLHTNLSPVTKGCREWDATM